jgi:hypothetical protein
MVDHNSARRSLPDAGFEKIKNVIDERCRRALDILNATRNEVD